MKIIIDFKEDCALVCVNDKLYAVNDCMGIEDYFCKVDIKIKKDSDREKYRKLDEKK